jgi:hypothetical protein
VNSLAICWQRARFSGRSDDVGHGFCIYAGAKGRRERLVAFVGGFAWCRGGNKAVVRFDPQLVPADKQLFAAFKAAVEAHIRTGDLSPSEIVPGYWGIANA